MTSPLDGITWKDFFDCQDHNLEIENETYSLRIGYYMGMWSRSIFCADKIVLFGIVKTDHYTKTDLIQLRNHEYPFTVKNFYAKKDKSHNRWWIIQPTGWECYYYGVCGHRKVLECSKPPKKGVNPYLERCTKYSGQCFHLLSPDP